MVAQDARGYDVGVRHGRAYLVGLSTLHLIGDGDHSFKVPKRSGRTADQVMAELADTIVAWAGALPHAR